MIVVVDTNILLSACITPNSKITEILLSSSSRIERISCHYLLSELFRHQPKLVQLSKQPADKVAIDSTILSGRWNFSTKISLKKNTGRKPTV